MTKVLEVSDEVHVLIKQKQLDLLEKYKIPFVMQTITNTAITEGINSVDERLVVKDKIYKIEA